MIVEVKVIVGLGNPGLEYEKTRHNAGFLAVDRLADRHGAGSAPRARFNALTLDTSVAGEKCLLMKPTTYMNRSGRSVGEALRFFKLDPGADVFVLVDDSALPLGAIRIRASGSSGGHNGLEDISRRLGTDAYTRCRIGIGSPGFAEHRDYVLGRFSKEQLVEIEPALERAADAAETWIREGVAAAMNKHNERRRGQDSAPEQDEDRTDQS